MHTCVHAGLHACTPLRMCKQRSTHKHTLACVRTWRILIIMIDHGKTSSFIQPLLQQAVCACMCSRTNTCLDAGLHACTPLLMCNQPSMHEHMLTCMHTWRVLIIMIDHSEVSGYNHFDLRAKQAVITPSSSGYMYMRVFTHAYLCACWSAWLYTFAYV